MEIIKRKLTSRKFWTAVSGFVVSVMMACGATEGSVTSVISIISGFATLIAYIVGEGLADRDNRNE